MSTIRYAQAAPTMSGVPSSTGDPIAKLPVDQSQPTNNELQIVNTLFTKAETLISLRNLRPSRESTTSSFKRCRSA